MRLEHAVDILLFNPPYVPTDTAEADSAQQDADISGAWAGGHDGMELTNILLDQVEVWQVTRGNENSADDRRAFCLRKDASTSSL